MADHPGLKASADKLDRVRCLQTTWWKERTSQLPPLTYALRRASYPQYIHVMDTVEGTATHGTLSRTEGRQEPGTVQKGRSMALKAS